MTCQITLGFATDLGRGGAWDEVYYTTDTDPVVAQQTWGATSGLLGLESTSILGKRLAMLSSECYLYYSRYAIVDTTPKGKSVLVRGTRSGFRSAENFAADACGFRLQSTDNLSKRNVRFGGLPDNVVADNTIDASFLQYYVFGANSFLQAWGAAGGCIRQRTTQIGGSFSQKIINVVKATQTALITITMAAPITGVAVNSTVVVSVRGQPQFRGNWQVAAISTDGTAITLRGSDRVSCSANPGGYVTLFNPGPIAFNFGTSSTPLPYNIAGLTPHKLGKKKYQPRSRRSPVLLRR